MNKIKIEETEVFKQVAKVIGEKQAKIELFKASKGWEEVDVEDILVGENLFASFRWCSTPQGMEFWDSINNGDNPYE